MNLPIEGADYFIRVIPFPPGVPISAFIQLNSDTTFTLFLNANADWEHRLDGYEHELWHMIRDDLYGEKDAYMIEYGRSA